MTFYTYDPVTFVLTGTRNVAQNPRTGAYAAPANSTHVAPPTLAADQAAVWSVTAGSWSVVADWRGVTFYSVATGATIQLALGEVPDATMTETAPIPPAPTAADLAKQALAKSDGVEMPRISEDLISTLIKKGVLAMTDLPQSAQSKLAARLAARATLTGTATAASNAGSSISTGSASPSGASGATSNAGSAVSSGSAAASGTTSTGATS
jgi:hypothetical protein